MSTCCTDKFTPFLVTRFEDLKDAVLRWLTYMENRLDDLDPVAVDIEIIEKQIEEIEVRFNTRFLIGCLFCGT